MPRPLPCPGCHQTEGLKVCARCKRVGYCGPEHQKAHWGEHKRLCADPGDRPRCLQREVPDGKLAWIIVFNAGVEHKRETAETIVAHARRLGALPEGREAAVHFAAPNLGMATLAPLQTAARTVVVGRALRAQALADALSQAIRDGTSTFVHDFLAADGSAISTWSVASGRILSGGAGADQGPS